MIIPNFVLKKLYKKGSLCQTPGGAAFILLNKIDTGLATGFNKVVVDGREFGPADIEIHVPGRPVFNGREISTGHPLPLEVGVEIALVIKGFELTEGKHDLEVAITVQDLGDLNIRLKDSHNGRRDDLVPEASTESAAKIAAADGSLPEEVATEDLPGLMAAKLPVKIVLLGAGSAVFARNFMNDILCIPGLNRGHFALVDIDTERLALAEGIAKKMIASAGRDWTVEATTERREVLADADFVISTIEVAGLRNVDKDYEIPLKYGVDQCVGDTIGPGGIFKMLRTGPTWLAILRDIAELAPEAIVMNYTNPMSALTILGLKAAPELDLVGLCHSVQGTSRQLALYADVPYEELEYEVAGINHMAWFTKLEHKGEDLYPKLFSQLDDSEMVAADPVRFEMMKHFGAFVTESSGHFSEYLPYFRKRADLIEKHTGEGQSLGASGAYRDHWFNDRENGDQTIRDILASDEPVMMQRSEEYASSIVQAWFTNRPAIIYGNVSNRGGLISNLPDSACVEVPVTVTSSGLNPQYFGELPEQMAALNRAHISIHKLMAKAVIEKDREAAVHALMLDPLTAAVCSPAEIRALFDEMWEAEKEDLEYFL